MCCVVTCNYDHLLWCLRLNSAHSSSGSSTSHGNVLCWTPHGQPMNTPKTPYGSTESTSRDSNANTVIRLNTLCNLITVVTCQLLRFWLLPTHHVLGGVAPDAAGHLVERRDPVSPSCVMGLNGRNAILLADVTDVTDFSVFVWLFWWVGVAMIVFFWIMC